MQSVTSLACLDAVLAATLGAIFLLVGWRPWLRERTTSRADASGTLALGLAFCIGEVSLRGPLQQAVGQGVFYLVLAVTLAGSSHLAATASFRTRLLGRTVATTTMLGIVLEPQLQSRWGIDTAAVWLAVLTAATLLIWQLLAVLAAQSRGPALPLALGIVTGCSAVSLAVSHNPALVVLATGLTATLVVWAGLSWWQPRIRLGGGAVAVLVLSLASLLIVGRFHGSLPTLSLFLLLAAVLAPWGAMGFVLQQRPQWQQSLAAGTLALVPAMLAVMVGVAAGGG